MKQITNPVDSSLNRELLSIGERIFNCPVFNDLPVLNGLPLTNNAPEDFLPKLAPHFSGNVDIIGASYYGGGGEESPQNASYTQVSLAVSQNGHVLLSGATRSDSQAFPPVINLPATQPAGSFVQDDLANTGAGFPQLDAFVAAFNPNFELVWATYFGGESVDAPTAVSISESDNRLYIVGNAVTNNLALMPGEIEFPTFEFDDTPGSEDFFQDEASAASGTLPSFAAMFTLDEVIVTSVREAQPETSLKIAPNPSSGIFYLTSDDFITHIRVYDVNGKLVFEKQAAGYSAVLDLSRAVGGLYFIQVEAGENFVTGKIVKQ